MKIYIFFVLRLFVNFGDCAHSPKDVPTHQEEGIMGDPVYLPCDISIGDGPNADKDAVILVLWYREDLGTPIYSVDAREREFRNAETWSDEKVFGPRAYFLPNKEPAQLAVDHVKDTDEGLYRCRVDFKFAQTRNSLVNLTIIAPAKDIQVTDEKGRIKKLFVGPYRGGDSLTLRCHVFGAKPPPTIIWYFNKKVIKKKTFSIGETSALDINIPTLQRSDLHSVLVCEASNHLKIPPISTALQIDMNFAPLDVVILDPNRPLTAGRRYDLICQSTGSRPPARITWWKDGKRLDKSKETSTSDGNTTISTLQFSPSKQDAGKYLSCKSENPEVNKEILETGWKLQIYYVPEAKVNLGSSLKGDNIREGADVYFDCIVNALPAANKVQWKQNGHLLQHNVAHGIIISNRSLVLQKVSRTNTGNYTCVAYNSEGEGESDGFTLSVLFAPVCKQNQTRVYGVAKLETGNISCEVEANPTDVVFSWTFNNSGESVDVGKKYIYKSGTTSVVSHTTNSDLDYGTLSCFATNRIGAQNVPCVFHVIHAGRPDKPSNCTSGNVTMFSFTINCTKGYDGGVPQSFLLEAYAAKELASNITSFSPTFHLINLQPGISYNLNLFAVNMKGKSEPATLQVVTKGEAERIENLTEERHEEQFQLTTTMSIVIGVVITLILAALILASALQYHNIRVERRDNKLKIQQNVLYSSTSDCSVQQKSEKQHPQSRENNIEADEPDIIPQPISETMCQLENYNSPQNRVQHVSTIDTKLHGIHTTVSHARNNNRNYQTYYTLRNGQFPQAQDFTSLSPLITGTGTGDPCKMYSVATLPRKCCVPCTGSNDVNIVNPQYRRRSHLACSIPEEDLPLTSPPLASPKQESAV